MYHTRCFLRDNTTHLSSKWQLHNKEEKYNVIIRNASSVIIELDEKGMSIDRMKCFGITIFIPNFFPKMSKKHKSLICYIGFVTEFNLSAERTYSLRRPPTECFFRFILESEYDKVSERFNRALNEEPVQFEFQDVFHRYYSSSFVPIGLRQLEENGDVTITKR